MRVDGVGRYEILGETIDDAALARAFDKSASSWAWATPAALPLSRLAEQGDPLAFSCRATVAQRQPRFFFC